jgi:HK97 family phage major capsid protein
MTTKEMRAARAKAVADARAIQNAVPDGHDMTAEQVTQFDAFMADADSLKVKIDREERLSDMEAHLNARNERRAGREGISTEEAAETERAESDAFRGYMRFGMNGLNDEQRAIAAKRFAQPRNAQGTVPDTAGGYTVPLGFYGQLTDAMLAFGGMINVANVFDTESGNGLPIPTDNDTANLGAILGENTQVGTQDVTFGSVMMNAHTYTSKLVLVANQLLQDSAFNLESFLAQKLGTRIARITNLHFTTGDGASKPTGVITAATMGQTGTTGETTSIIFDDLIELEHSVDPAYRPNARFMMNDQTLKIIKKLKDSQNRPLWLPGYAMKEPDTINGYGYEINQQMAIPAANAKSIAFGDFKNYFIRRVAGVQVLRLVERYADFNQTGFLAFQRYDGQLVDAGTHPIKYFQHSAS